MEPGERWALPKRSTACAEAPQLGGARGQQAGQALLRTYYVPGSIPDVGERDVNKTDRVPMAWGRGGGELSGEPYFFSVFAFYAFFFNQNYFPLTVIYVRNQKPNSSS